MGGGDAAPAWSAVSPPRRPACPNTHTGCGPGLREPPPGRQGAPEGAAGSLRISNNFNGPSPPILCAGDENVVCATKLI